MYYYRITKYNPIHRNEMGWYTKDEWTDFSCVGHYFEGKLCTFQDYKSIENVYINAVLAFMDHMNIDNLTCNYLEKWKEASELQDLPMQYHQQFKSIKNDTFMSRQDMPIFLKLVLRGYIWCKLNYDNKMFVHFGYDYYMFIGVEKECNKIVDQVNKSGLFVEKFISPYLNQNID